MDLGQASRPKRQLTVPSYAESSASSEKSSGEEFTLGDELDEEEEDLSSRDLSEKYQLSASVVMSMFCSIPMNLSSFKSNYPTSNRFIDKVSFGLRVFKEKKTKD